MSRLENDGARGVATLYAEEPAAASYRQLVHSRDVMHLILPLVIITRLSG
jgi:hypothetical protein